MAGSHGNPGRDGWQLSSPWIWKGYLPLYQVADTPFHIQGNVMSFFNLSGYAIMELESLNEHNACSGFVLSWFFLLLRLYIQS